MAFLSMFTRLLIILSLTSYFSAQAQESDTEPLPDSTFVESFQYSGYGDTVYAFLSGNIYEVINGMKKPLDSVQIVSVRPIPDDSLTYTDKTGDFSMAFPQGTFTVLIRKKGYQSLRLVNYEADPDQFSDFKAFLRKGNGEITVDVSKSNYNK